MSESINEVQLDNITHATASILKTYGIELDNDKLTDLNDHLAAFINGNCGYNIEATGTKDNTSEKDNVIEVAFDVLSGTVTQIVEIVEPYYDEEQIIEGLATGKMVTTMGHDKNPASIDITETGETVAIILSQEVDGEYEDFR